jgi:hypothetical protein
MNKWRLKLFGKLAVDTLRLAALDTRDGLETARNVKRLHDQDPCHDAAQARKPQAPMRAD